jgi:predicted esterase
MLTPFEPWADASGAILVAFSSFAYTWDAVIGRFGVDTDHAAKVIAAAFDRCAIDPARVGLAGFSDGATYALALGRANGNLFTRVAAFSPGYLIDVATEGKPEFFISHGTSDGVLFIDNSSRKIVPWLRKRHYEVDYREFDGGHQIPKEMADIAIPWLAAAR